MSKQTDDLIDRISGVTVALKGCKVQLTAVPAVPQTPDMPGRPGREVEEEDWAQAKKLAAELKDLAENLEAEISRESKVPDTSGKGKSGAAKQYPAS